MYKYLYAYICAYTGKPNHTRPGAPNWPKSDIFATQHRTVVTLSKVCRNI